MKVAVIGNGNVGMATFKELLKLREIQELVLIGRNQERLHAEIEDFLDANILSTEPTAKLSYGGYEKTEGADIIVYTAGVGQKPGQSRLELVGENAKITRTIFEEVKKYNQNAIIVALSNPVDIITAVIQETTGFPRERVIGTGTLLDTARLTRYISSLFDLSPLSTTMFVLGEHGDSSCVIWSSIRILGMTLDQYFSTEVGESAKVKHDIMSQNVRETAGKIISAKGYTAYGVAAAARRVVSSIINDTHEILPVSIRLKGEYGTNGIATSVPVCLGKNGVLSIKQMIFTEEEKAAFEKSAAILTDIAKSVGIQG